jgi:small subunit ribosomal protein S10
MYHLNIYLKSYRKELFIPTIQKINQCLSMTSSIEYLNKTKKLFTVLRSPHIDKKSREQFHLVRYQLVLTCKISNIDAFFLLMQLFSFYGVQIKISLKHTSYSSDCL